MQKSGSSRIITTGTMLAGKGVKKMMMAPIVAVPRKDLGIRGEQMAKALKIVETTVWEIPNPFGHFYNIDRK